MASRLLFVLSESLNANDKKLQEVKARLWKERMNIYCEYSTKNTYSHRHTNSYYPNPCCTLGLCMCFLEYVCVCVWALLCLQDAQRRTGSLKSFGYKVKRGKASSGDKERGREIERGKRNKTQQHPQREGRLSKVWPTFTLSVWCWQSPLHTHFPGGEQVFTLTQMWHLSSWSILLLSPPRPFSKQ